MVVYKNMSDHTGAILIEDPHTASGLMTFRVNGASELKPGYVCTAFGHTAPDIGKIDAADDPALGVVLDNADLPIDDYFPDNTEVTVAMAGSGAVVWVYHHDHDGAIVAGYKVIGHSGDNGHVTNSESIYEHIGIVMEDKGVTDGYYTPIKIRLD